MNLLRCFFVLGLSFGCAFLPSQSQGATDFPTRTVRIIVNSAAGGTTDLTTRIIKEELERKWKHAVLVEDVTGAGGNVGAAQVARAEPDGYTLLVSHPGPITVNNLLFKEMAYDPAKFVPITVLVKVPNVLVVRNGLGVNTPQDLIDHAKRNPGKVTYGSQGIGSTTNLTASLLGTMAGVELVHVPYRGSPQAIQDLSGGRLDMMFDNIGSALPHHQSGSTKIIGVADTERASALPGTPTLAESGLPGFRSITWFGLVAPAGTPQEIVDRINRDFVEILQLPEVRAKVAQFGAEPVASTPADAAKFLADESALWSKVIKDANAAPQ
jgi:tripartite-type tricarboxylate transporter receptor subunit TctC